jgi:hypothetical protein
MREPKGNARAALVTTVIGLARARCVPVSIGLQVSAAW